MASEETKTTQVFRVYIKASPQAVWDAITKREWTERYGYGGGPEHDLDKTGPYRFLTSEKMKADSIAMGYARTRSCRRRRGPRNRRAPQARPHMADGHGRPPYRRRLYAAHL